MRENVIEVRNLNKSFGDKVAVDDLSFTVPKGQILGLLGVNGAGKTTTINMLLGLLTPSGGSIRILGLEQPRHRVAILQRANFCSTYANLPSNLKVHQNLWVFARIYQVKNSKKKIEELLERFEISHLRDAITGHLSSGESTRLNLCKAFLNDPEVLLLDEPTASLDPHIADKVRKAIRSIQKEKDMTVLYTSHNMKDIEEICDQVLFMHKGKILTQGTASDIVRQFQEESLEGVFIRVARGGDIEPDSTSAASSADRKDGEEA